MMVESGQEAAKKKKKKKQKKQTQEKARSVRKGVGKEMHAWHGGSN